MKRVKASTGKVFRLVAFLFLSSIIMPFTANALADSLPVPKPLPSACFISRYGSLHNFFRQVRQHQKTTVAFLGGSITHMKGWRDKVMQYLTEQYPGAAFSFINAGIPSLGSVPHAFRLQQDVLDKGKIDLLFIESAVNDHVNGTPETQQRKALEGIVRRAYTANPEINMVLMAFADEDKMADYKAGKIPTEIKVHESVAQYYHIPFINLALEVTRRIEAGEFSWEKDFQNLHPSPFGQTLYANTINTLLHLEETSQGKEAYTLALPHALQQSCYDAGRYLAVSNAKALSGFSFIGSWHPADSAGTRSGFVHVPVLEATHPGASFDLSFTGTTVGIAVVSGPDAGKISYTIDGGNEQTIDLYTQWSKGLHLPWYLVLGDGLAKGRHTLKVKINNDHAPASKGDACRVVHFLVNG